MIVCLLEGVPLAVGIIVAGLDAVFQVSNFEGIDEVSFTLDCLMTLASRTPGVEIKRFIAKKHWRRKQMSFQIFHIQIVLLL